MTTVVALGDVFKTIRANLTEIRKATGRYRDDLTAKRVSGDVPPPNEDQKAGASLVAAQAGTVLLALIGKSLAEMDEFAKDPCCQEHYQQAVNATLTAVSVLASAHAQIMGAAGVFLDMEELDRDVDQVIDKVEQFFIKVPQGMTPAEAIAEANLSRLGDVTRGVTNADPTQPLDPDVSGMTRH